jgi:Protein of unknown function (DUF1569)
MKNIFDPTNCLELQSRLDTLTPESPRRWGRMTPNQAICHLNDWFLAALGDRPLPIRPPDLKTKIICFLAFTSPMPWPKGVKTSGELDAEQGGTPPAGFDQDRAELLSLMARFVKSDVDKLNPHYKWGTLSRAVWGRYGYRHIDHHLRQFGV